jgi:predicted DCC family thiol-disulfide oxidoreductase YuxK
LYDGGVGGDSRHLLFDASCRPCSRIAETIGDAGSGKLSLVDINSELGVSLLRRAFPAGWKRAPYLAEVRGDAVHAWTGSAAKWRLALVLGVIGSWRVWRTWRSLRREVDAARR